MASRAVFPSEIQFGDINPDELQGNDGSAIIKSKTGLRFKTFAHSRHVSVSASQLPGMLDGCDDEDRKLYPSDPMIKNPNPVRLPSYHIYPAQSPGGTSFYCCKDFSQTPIHTLFKAVLEHVYCFVLNRDINFSSLYAENHKKLHRIIEELHCCFEQAGLLRMYERIAKTMADGRATDTLINYSLKSETLSYSNAAGEFLLTESFLIEAFSLRETDESPQYSDLQPVTPYFLRIIHESSSDHPCKRLIVEEIPGDASVFMVRTTIPANRDYLPLLYCLGMIIGCPYAGYMSSKMWIFRKEVLYLCAKVFGVLDFNIARMLFDLMKADMIHRKNFCRPLWRVLMAIERSVMEPECLSHIPRTTVTVVELSRFTELVKRSMQLMKYDEAEINLEHSRILNLYDCKYEPSSDHIIAALMYERRHLKAAFPQFIPKIKWIHKRRGKEQCCDAGDTLEEEIDSLSQIKPRP